MNEYSAQTVTVEDISPDERGSTFTDCIFEETAGGVIFKDINFSFCIFNGCTWNADVNRCNFKSCDGDSLPPLTTISFNEAPDKGTIFRVGESLITGDSSTVDFQLQGLDIEVMGSDLTGAGYSEDDYTITRGRVSHGTAWGEGILTRSEYLSQPVLELSTDVSDTADPINGIPDIPADGVSSCSIFIKKKDRAGTYLTDAGDDDTIDLQCTRGKLSDLRVDLVNGEASVTLTSVPETCVSDIKAIAESMEPVSIQIQFAP